MAESIITTLQTLMAGIASGFATATTAIGGMFYTDNALTPLGVLLLVGFSLSAVYFIIRLIMRIVRAR